MENNERDQLIDDNQSGQNTQRQWRNSDEHDQVSGSLTEENDNEYPESDVRPSERNQEPAQASEQWRTNIHEGSRPLTDDDDDDDDDSTENNRRPSFETDRDERGQWQQGPPPALAGDDEEFSASDTRPGSDTGRQTQDRDQFNRDNDSDQDRSRRNREEDNEIPERDHRHDFQNPVSDDDDADENRSNY